MLQLNDSVGLPSKIALNMAYLALWPLVKLFDYRTERRHDRRDGYLRQGPAPLPLDTPRFRRRRALTIEHGKVPGKVVRTQNQQHLAVSLLSLPAEIREVIWKEVFGNSVFHLGIKERKFKGSRCLLLDNCRGNYAYGCLCHRIVSWEGGSQIFGIMGLLQSCRQM
jgi:hypothetical protein